MAIIPLYGHGDITARVESALARNALPSSLLLHGARGIGKQRLALWIAQRLLCDGNDKPCGECQACRFVLDLRHPDVHWFFPRPRLKDADDLDKVRMDNAEAIAERASQRGLYETPSGMEGIFFDVVRVIVQKAVMSPALAKRKVFIIGDAERMVTQEGNEEGANAFLKLLEEPPEDTTILLTSSEPGALLPTIRSRVVPLRVRKLDRAEVRRFVENAEVGAFLNGIDGLPKSSAELDALADGAPGRLVSGGSLIAARDAARRMLDAATGKPSARFEVAWGTASTKARGAFADTLEALTGLLHDRAKADVARGQDTAARNASRAMELVEVAKERVENNIAPQLITVNLLRDLRELLA